MSQQHFDTIIVGGGPGGITALKTQSIEAGFNCILFEQEREIGGTFRYRSYENSELVSSKQLTAFSDFRFPATQGDHVSLPEYCRYLERYVDEFDLWDKVNTSCRVVGIEKEKSVDQEGKEEERHVVTVEKRNEKGEKEGELLRYTSKYLILSTGLHCIPQIPTIKGMSSISNDPSKRVIHSSEHKKRSDLKGRKVMILGTGETGMDLAYESIKAGAKEVYLCSRGGFLSFPKVLNNFTILGSTFDGNLPIDGLITNLFESTYVHRWVAESHLRWFISDFVIKRVLWALTGTQAGCNQWVGELPSERLGRAFVHLNKSHKATPYLNRPYKQRSKFLSFLSEYHDPIEDTETEGIVEMCPWPKGIVEEGEGKGRVEFDWEKCRERGGSWKKVADRMEGREIEPDLVIFASGYRQDFSSFLSPSYPRPWDCTIRDIISPLDPTVAYIGFVRPGVGAIPPIAEQQSMWITSLWTRKGPLASREGGGLPKEERGSYYLLAKEDSRIKYGVDHSTYMSTLAKDFGGLPGLWELWRVHGLFITFIYCFSASFTSHYRLVPSSPFYNPKMIEVETTEIWDTIKRRGVVGNLFMGVIPMMFYAVINLTAFFLELVWIASGRPNLLPLYNKLRHRPTSSPSKMDQKKDMLKNGGVGEMDIKLMESDDDKEKEKILVEAKKNTVL